jgi:hypothetical protein
MSITLVGSVDVIDFSDSSSRTESEESTPPRPGQDDDVAQSPFVPQRVRLMPGGPPVYLGEPLHIDVPRFLVDPEGRAVPGQSLPGDMPLNPTFHPDIDALEETLRCLKHQSVELGPLHVHSRMSREHRETTAKTDVCVRLWRSLEPDGFVPPALVRAQSSKNQDRESKSSRGPLPILVAGLTATIAYFMTGSWIP